MKIGDMVRISEDNTRLCGIGFVVSLLGSRQSYVFWLDEGATVEVWNSNMDKCVDGTWISWIGWKRTCWERRDEQQQAIR